MIVNEGETMFRRIAVATSVMALFTATAASASITVSGGTRGATISATGPIGQTFVADGTALTSFGFQFGVGNSASANAPVTLQLLSGAGLTGPVLATRTATLTVPTGRTLTWYDFDLSGTALIFGQSYTALLATTSNRLLLGFGPTLTTSNVPTTGDAYAAGQLVSAGFVDASGANGFCATSGTCDANFRFTTSAAAAAVPEVATWLMMVAGLGVIGGSLRRRRQIRAVQVSYI
jgi:hypothetical protein